MGAPGSFLAVAVPPPGRDWEAPPWCFEMLNQLPGAGVTKAVT